MHPRRYNYQALVWCECKLFTAYSCLACMPAFFVSNFGSSMHDAEMNTPGMALQSRREGN